MTQEQRLLESYQKAADVHRIATRAVRRAQEESRRLGVPNVYSRNGRLYYELEQPTAMESAREDADQRDAGDPDAGLPGQS